MRRIGVFLVVTLVTISLVVGSSDDPLSDEFIEEINRKATTWKVCVCPKYGISLVSQSDVLRFTLQIIIVFVYVQAISIFE